MWKVIVAAALRGKRLRKRQWTLDKRSVFTLMQEANDYLRGKYFIREGAVYYNFRIEQRKGQVVSMPDDEYYYYQVVSCDRLVSWQAGYNEVIASGTAIEF